MENEVVKDVGAESTTSRQQQLIPKEIALQQKHQVIHFAAIQQIINLFLGLETFNTSDPSLFAQNT